MSFNKKIQLDGILLVLITMKSDVSMILHIYTGLSNPLAIDGWGLQKQY